MPPWSAAESVLRDAVCAFDDSEMLPTDVHTVDALVSAMRRRQWLSAEDTLVLHTTLVDMFPMLVGTPRSSRRLAGEASGQVRKRPPCIPALLDSLATAVADADEMLDALTEALTTPAGVRTDPDELRGALGSLVDREPGRQLDEAASLQQFALHLTTCAYAAHGRLGELAAGSATDPDVDLAGRVLWVLLDCVRDGAWRTEAHLGSLRGSLFSQLRVMIPAFEVGPAVARPRLDPAVAARIVKETGVVLSELQSELADLREREQLRAANLLVDALAALSQNILDTAADARPLAAVFHLRTLVVRMLATAGANEPASSDRSSVGAEPAAVDVTAQQERVEAALETVDALAQRVRTWPDNIGLIDLVAEAFAEVLGHFDAVVDVDDLAAAFRHRWPES